MSRQSIREVLARYTPFKRAGIINPKGEGQLLPGVENLCWEVYNPGPEPITFKTFHPQAAQMWFYGKPPAHWATIVCGVEEWAFLPHRMYTAHVPSGNQNIKVTVNMGDSMFIGNKLPSRPEVRKIRVGGTGK